jgi:ferric-chelate reductase
MPFAVVLASAVAPAPTPAPAPVDPNKAIRIARFFAYPKQILYLLASFIFLVSLLHYLALAHRYFTRRRVYPERKATDAQHVSWGRLPAAVVDSLRALAFRWTVPLGFGYTLNLAEVGLTVGYIGVLFTWTFVNSTSCTHPCIRGVPLLMLPPQPRTSKA